MPEPEPVLERVSTDFYRGLVKALEVSADELQEHYADLGMEDDENVWHLREAARLLKDLNTRTVYGRIIGYFVELQDADGVTRVELRLRRLKPTRDNEQGHRAADSNGVSDR